MASFKEAEGRDMLRLLYENPDLIVAVDTEGTGLHIPGRDHAIGVSIAFVLGDLAYSHYFGFRHETGENCSEDTLDQLRWVLEDGRPLIFANAPYDIPALQTLDIDTRGSTILDVIIIAHFCDENQPTAKSLDNLAHHYLDAAKISDPFVEQQKKSGNKAITPEQMYEYAIIDAQLTWRLYHTLITHPVWTDELPEGFWEHKQRMILLIGEMKRRGVLIDQELCSEYLVRGEERMRELGIDLGYPPPKAPTKANPNRLPVMGPKALEDLFINRLGLPVVKRTKTERISFDKEVMEEYDLMLERLDSPEAKKVKEYRGWQKAVGAAYRAYLELVDPDGRLRCSYKLHGTKTGRLSCEKPNLQQVPKTTDKPWNGRVKDCFIAQPGYTLINADFSQLELRLGTAYAGEESLKQVFEEGRDIFTEMAENLGWPRHQTKTFVYSVQYGAGVNRIMHAFGVTKTEAQSMLRQYRQNYPRFQMLADICSARGEDQGKVKLWSGRYRHFQYKSEAYKAMNSVIQGGAADVVERVMLRCWDELDNEEECRMLLQVHDSITFEVRTDLVDQYMPRIKMVMEDVSGAVGHNDFDVKFAVDVDFWTERERENYQRETGMAA